MGSANLVGLTSIRLLIKSVGRRPGCRVARDGNTVCLRLSLVRNSEVLQPRFCIIRPRCIYVACTM